MKEAIANAGVFNIIIVFVVILMAFFVGSLGYSKAFKVKNRILLEIEKDEGYAPYDTFVVLDGDSTQERIERWLSTIGYRRNVSKSTDMCAKVNDSKALNDGNPINAGGDYQYCIYEFNTCNDNSNNKKCSRYYRAVAYMYFDIPIIGDLIAVPVVGESKPIVTLNS